MLNTDVIAIDATTSGVAVRLRDNSGTRTVEADRVVCTIPFSVLRGLALRGVPASVMQRIATLSYAPASKTLVHTASRFWEEQGIRYGGGSASDRGLRQVFYPLTAAYDDTCRCGVLLASYAIGGDALALSFLDEDSRTSCTHAALARLHPQITGPEMVLAQKTQDWHTHPYSLGAYASDWLPGQSSTDLDARFSSGSRIIFAGDHCSTNPGWLEGAIESGDRAAEAAAIPVP